MEKNVFYQRLVEFRLPHESDRQLARRLGIKSQSFSQWRRGAIPSTRTLIKISKALKLPVDEVLGWAGRSIKLSPEDTDWAPVRVLKFTPGRESDRISHDERAEQGAARRMAAMLDALPDSFFIGRLWKETRGKFSPEEFRRRCGLSRQELRRAMVDYSFSLPLHRGVGALIRLRVPVDRWAWVAIGPDLNPFELY